jgi:predicted MFS family arabinose efflux permease
MYRRVAAAVGGTVEGLRGDGRGWVVVTVALGWFLVVGTMLTLPALLPRIIDEFGVSNATAGLAVTTLWLVYGALQFPAGLLTDRVGERLMLLGSMTTGVVVAAAFALAPSFPAFVVACGVLGVVGGLFATPRVTLLSRLYPDRSGTALGTVMSFGNVGASLLPVAAGLVAGALGWRFGFGVAVPLFLVAVLAVWVAVPGRSEAVDAAPDRSLREVARPLARQLTSREILLVTAGVTLTFFTFQGLTAFLTTYLVTAKGLSGGTATLLFGALFAVAAVTQPVAGRVADDLGERSVLVAITGAYAVLLVGLVLSGSLLALAPLVVLLGTQRGATPVATAYLTAALPEEIRGTGYGLLRTVFTGVSSSAAVVVGLLADRDLFDAAFLALAGLAALATACYLLLPRQTAGATGTGAAEPTDAEEPGPE